MPGRHCNPQPLSWLGGRCVQTWLRLLWVGLSEFTGRFLVSDTVAISRKFSFPHGWISSGLKIITSSFPKFKERNSTRPQVFLLTLSQRIFAGTPQTDLTWTTNPGIRGCCPKVRGKKLRVILCVLLAENSLRTCVPVGGEAEGVSHTLPLLLISCGFGQTSPRHGAWPCSGYLHCILST